MSSGPGAAAPGGLFADLYELTMAASYLEHGMLEPATFSLYARTLPPGRGFLVAAGLEQALDMLGGLRFSRPQLDYLDSLGLFSPRFLDYLGGFRFTGDVRAMAEGTVFFATEPLLEVTAPLIEAQIVETMLLNVLHVNCLAASKAARCVLAARGRRLVDFGFRRTHGLDAALAAARASYIAGFAATSNLIAGHLYGIPVVGTMAHSYVMAVGDEAEAFRRFTETYRRGATLVIDTYDTLRGARLAAAVGQELAARGGQLRGVRLDSGDLLVLSREVRAALDRAGLRDVQIYASGGLDEFAIERLVSAGAPIDGFGVGTALGVSADAPALDLAYKLVEYAGRPCVKLSAAKETLPGRKQVFRCISGGRFDRDIVALADEEPPRVDAALEVRPLLGTVMRGGAATAPVPLSAARERFAAELRALPREHARLREPAPYRVERSAAIEAEAGRLRERYGSGGTDSP